VKALHQTSTVLGKLNSARNAAKSFARLEEAVKPPYNALNDV
jgi:hypothetical protein